MNKLSIKLKVVAVSLLFLFSVVFLDRLLFSHLLFYLPNETGWDTSPWYNFLHKINNIHFDKQEKGVIITGSSVALYAALPEKLKERLNENKQSKYSVEFYSHVAMSPTDLYYYSDHIISLKPQKVLYLLNPGDFQFDHWKGDKFSEEEKTNTYTYRNPTRYNYPLSYLLDNWKKLPKNEILHLLSKGFLRINGFRSFLFDPWNSYIERHFRQVRSYHTYTGMVPDNGIWRQGWTQDKFSIDCELKSNALNEAIFTQLPDTRVTISDGSKEVFSKLYTKSGWHTIRLSFPKQEKVNLSFSIDKKTSSKLVNPKEYGKEYFYGIRLSGNFCRKEIAKNTSYIRENFLDEQRFSSMSLEEYTNDYNQRLYVNRENRPEVYRMGILKDGKLAVKDKPFQPWSEILILKEIVAKFQKSGIPFVIVNSPENPIDLSLYSNGIWYKGLLEYLNSLQKGSQTKFVDKKDFFANEPQMFIDPHHLTYPASVRFNEVLAEIIKEE